MDLMLHIGLPKTGTTTIQSQLLSGGTGYLGKSVSGESILSNRQIYELYSIAARSRFLNEKDVQSMTAAWISRATVQAVNGGFEKLSLSQENLAQWWAEDTFHSRYPLGSIRARAPRRQRPAPISEYLKRYLVPMWSGHGRCRVVLTLRNQPDFLASLYAECSNYRWKASQKDFERQIRKLIDTNDPYLDWETLITELEDAVGVRNVSVLLYEDIGKGRFWKDLAEAMWLDYPINSGDFSHKQNARANPVSGGWRLRPLKNPISPMVSNHWPRVVPGGRVASVGARRFIDAPVARIARIITARARTQTVTVPEWLRAEIHDFCGPSNVLLSKRLNRDLSQLGY